MALSVNRQPIISSKNLKPSHHYSDFYSGDLQHKKTDSTMKRIVLLLTACSAFFSGFAQVSITSGTLLYTQNFDNLDTVSYSTSAPGSTNLPTGWSIFEYGTSTTRVNNGYVGDNGGSNTGDTYSYGSYGSTERALGSVGSGSLQSNYGVKFVNNTGASITSVTIRYRGEQWRLGQASRSNLDSLRFLYSTTASDVSDTAASKWTLDNNLTFTTPNMTAATAGALDGNLSTNTTTKMGTLTTTIANGGTFVIRWFDPNVLGSDDGLAVDSVYVLFTLGGPAGSKPSLISHTPASNATGVSPSTTLTMVFDKQVVAGSGSIYIKNRKTQTTTTIAATDPKVTITGGYVVTVTGLGLASTSSTYHVTFDSTAFDTASFHSYGLYDTTAWKFTTAGVGVTGIQEPTLRITAINPAANGTFTILCNMPQAATLTARVYDLTGREAAVRTFNAGKGDNRLPIQTSLAAGSYIIRVDDGEQWGSVKVTMQ
jgi:hypothetical protein